MEFLSECIADFYIKRNIISECEKNVYKYGVQLILNDVFTFTIIIIFSILFWNVKYGAEFLLTLCVTRVFCGGFHAKKAYICKLSMIITFVCVMLVYEYDLNGNRILMDDESGEYTYTYDARDRLLTVTKDDADYLSYEYDLVGNLSKMYAGASLHSSYTYDANNRVTKVNDITYAYDANGNLASITTDAGTTAYEYNKNNAVTKVTNTLADETVISMYAYTYYSNKEYENYPQTYNHVAYSEFPGAYANNLIYDITYEILNGTYNVETGTWNNSNLNDFFPEEEIVKND